MTARLVVFVTVATAGVLLQAQTNSYVSPLGHRYTYDTSSETDNQFDGTDRKASKTSFVSGAMQKFKNLEEFVVTLPSDSLMLHHNPPISKSATSERVAEEKHNVMVNAFVYAIQQEADNDYHIILGSDPKRSKKIFFNIEVSGLPDQQSPYYKKLSSIRAYCDKYLGNFIQSGKYHKFQQPILVSVGGSIFYDIDHKPGVVGPAGMRPNTAWEIHPVTFLKFEPKMKPAGQ
ncbi:MAG: hypothetical protein PHP42_07770 [Bacteroidota bacterium]|nr:hypothetical protein [Bacteroidota bacterium]